MGFGIIKARIGDESVVRISVMSSLYFTMASIDSYLRLAQTENRNENRQLVLAAVPLALIDSLICYWIFTSLIQTIRALRLRRNSVKLQFYVHFKNVLIFGVTMSITFMIYSIKIHKDPECAWKDLWIDVSFWHVLFSILLTVIAFLWRPTKNNQQYAFAPLLNENDDDDEEEVHFSADTHETLSKVRSSSKAAGAQSEKAMEEDSMMKWVEENIANSSILLDSDDELMNTKFEVSKMQ
jgi:cbb3-type cytochrome oxidase subunit 3